MRLTQHNMKQAACTRITRKLTFKEGIVYPSFDWFYQRNQSKKKIQPFDLNQMSTIHSTPLFSTPQILAYPSSHQAVEPTTLASPPSFPHPMHLHPTTRCQWCAPANPSPATAASRFLFPTAVVVRFDPPRPPAGSTTTPHHLLIVGRPRCPRPPLTRGRRRHRWLTATHHRSSPALASL